MYYTAIALLVLYTVARCLQLRYKGSQAKEVLSPFLAPPYVQLGPLQPAGREHSLEIIWLSSHSTGQWSVEYRSEGSLNWQQAEAPERRTLKLEQSFPCYRFTALLTGLPFGSRFAYRIILNGRLCFAAEAKTAKGPGQSYRFALVGDLIEGTSAGTQIAKRIFSENPDLFVIAGDVVYKRGTLSEYVDKFFPAYNARPDGTPDGAPLLRSIPTVAAFGNHDAGMNNPADNTELDKHPDQLAYFLVWSLPANGPALAHSRNSPRLTGEPARKEALLHAAAWRYPRMANYSFDYGDSHWLVLDANGYMSWSNQVLRDFVEQDLAASQARWKFVCFHQPAFTTDVKHADEQAMRLLADIFEKHGVDVVFSGHNHCYERCYPLRFELRHQRDGSAQAVSGRVDGKLLLDREFDGKNNTRPQGILYLVSGAGGARLYLSPERRANHAALPPYTFKLVDDIHSFTVCDVSAGELRFRQVAVDGSEIDSFVLTK